jgi:hypothetical protein
MPPRRLIALAALAFACTPFDDAVNAAAFERYTKVLATPGVTIESCAMQDRSRAGYCLLSGTPEAVATFLDGLPLAPVPDTPRFGRGCRVLDRFGRADPEGRGRLLAEGGRGLRPDGPLPPNQSNVHLRDVVVDPTGTRVCLAYDFPYG